MDIAPAIIAPRRTEQQKKNLFMIGIINEICVLCFISYINKVIEYEMTGRLLLVHLKLKTNIVIYDCKSDEISLYNNNFI